MGGSQRNTLNPEIDLQPQTWQCEWCGATFVRRWRNTGIRGGKVTHKPRFCDTSCAASWRMNQPEIKAKIHTKENLTNLHQSLKNWWASGSSEAEANRHRWRQLGQHKTPETLAKISQTLRAMGHGPTDATRGGNGRPPTKQESILLEVLGPNWIYNYAISLGARKDGYPTCYKVDVGNPQLKIGIEADGRSHNRIIDQKKDEMLTSLGWTVLRFSNQDILIWKDSGMPTDHYISTTLVSHDIRLSV